MTTLYDEVRELQEEVQRLQKALNFWLPSVPADGPEEIADRIAHDAILLLGHEPEGGPEQDAETRGWVRLQFSISGDGA